MIFHDWIKTTINVLNGKQEAFLPAIADPAEQNIRVLEGIPEGVSQTDALQDWMARLAIADCFFAVASESDVVTVGHRVDNLVIFAAIKRGGSGWSAMPCEKPDWWRT